MTCAFPRPGPTDEPGTISSKWLDRNTNKVMCRRMVDTDLRDGLPNSVARMGLGEYFADTTKDLKEGIRPWPEQRSESEKWRPSFNPIEAPGSDHLEKPRGLGRVQLKDAIIPRRSEMRHIRQVESKEEVSDLPQGVAIVRTPRGGRAAEIPAQEVCVEQVMGHKKNVPGVFAQRNGLNMASGGDKPYRHPDYKTGFFAERELSVGSSFVRGSFPSTMRRNASSWKQFLGDPNRKKGKTWKERQREEITAEMFGVVEKLGSWENETLKECPDANFSLTDSEGET